MTRCRNLNDRPRAQKRAGYRWPVWFFRSWSVFHVRIARRALPLPCLASGFLLRFRDSCVVRLGFAPQWALRELAFLFRQALAVQPALIEGHQFPVWRLPNFQRPMPLSGL